MYRLITIHPTEDIADAQTIWREHGIQRSNDRHSPLAGTAVVAAILDSEDNIHWPSTLYLSEVAQSSRSVVGDTVVSYARSLIAWLNYLSERGVIFIDATERDLQMFRNYVWNARPNSISQFPISKSTVTARVETAMRFHEWGEKTKRFSSPLGEWAHVKGDQSKAARQGPYFSKRSAISLSPSRRIPRIVNSAELKKIISSAPQPYSLIFKWAVTTGLRRMELCELTKSRLDTVSYHGETKHVMSFDTVRKGGRRVAVYLPSKILHDTQWYLNMNRPKAQAGGEPFLFLTSSGYKLHREEVSRVFRFFADQAGTSAVFHHLRHTYAVTTLETLQRQANAGSSINPLKTLQVLMGHTNITSTEIYLTALDVYSDDVAEALDFLYGAAT